MAVKDDNKRISVKFSKGEYEILEKLAKDELRSVSNYIYKIVKENVKELNKK